MEKITLHIIILITMIRTKLMLCTILVMLNQVMETSQLRQETLMEVFHKLILLYMVVNQSKFLMEMI